VTLDSDPTATVSNVAYDRVCGQLARAEVERDQLKTQLATSHAAYDRLVDECVTWREKAFVSDAWKAIARGIKMTITLSVASLTWAVVALLSVRMVVALASTVLAARHARQVDAAALAQEIRVLSAIVNEHAPVIRDMRVDLTRLKNLEGID